MPYRRLAVTLNQLKVFVLVVRLGSFRSAANALGISEPAVCQAISALRQSLGDQLVDRAPGGLELTPAGRRVVGLASQIVNLAVEAESAVRQAQGGPELLRVVAGATVAGEVAPALLQAFAGRAGGVEATLGVGTTDDMAALLVERLVDVALGPRLAGPTVPGVVSEPFMRYRLVLVVGRCNPLAAQPTVGRQALAGVDWYVDPTGTDPRSDVGQLITAIGVPERRVSVFSDQRAAWAAAAVGSGVAPVVEHLLARERQQAVVALNAAGTPVEHFWYANMLTPDRRSTATNRLLRFLSTPDAMQAMHRADGRVPASRFRPPVFVTIWS